MQNQVSTTNKQATPNVARPQERNFFSTLLNLLDIPRQNDLHRMEPKIEVSENKKNVLVTAEIPGVNENDIELEISTNGYLTISGEKKHENTELSTNGGYFSEISYGRVSRTIPLPWDLDYDKAFADYNNGILTVTLPKSNIEHGKRQKININKQTKKAPKKTTKQKVTKQ